MDDQQHQASNTSESGTNIFKQCHNHHKRKPEYPDRLDDFEEVLDFHQHHPSIKTVQRFAGYVQDASFGNSTVLGLSCYPGFFFFPSALSLELQRNLAYKALTEYCEPPHRTNIDLIPPKPSEIEEDIRMWNIWCMNEDKRRYRCFHKLSWSTLGYFYDWTERCYHKDQHSTFPTELAVLGRHFAQISQSLTKQETSYEPSACIVNYYSEKGVMGGHRDELELALDKPIVSINLGRPAVFLLGSKSLQEGPIVPMIVRPGDVIVMGGDVRLNYHSMSRVLPNALPNPPIEHGGRPVDSAMVFGPDLQQVRSRQEHDLLDKYLSGHRININIRQVYNS